MVLGPIINWVVFRTLDLTVSTIYWVTTKTATGIYNVGHYLIVPKKEINSANLDESFDMVSFKLSDINTVELELNLIKEQNQLLKQEIELIKTKQ